MEEPGFRPQNEIEVCLEFQQALPEGRPQVYQETVNQVDEMSQTMLIDLKERGLR